MQKDDIRNTIVFVIFALAVLFLYQTFVTGPIYKKQEAAAKAQAAAVAAAPLLNAAPGAAVFQTRDQVIAQGQRIPIATPALKGSIALKGARIDDLFVTQYPETLAKNSPPVELFRPEGAKQAYFADFGWVGQNIATTNASTPWTLTSGSTLTPTTPVTLTYDNGAGLVFTRTIAVDDKFMFTVTDAVANKGAAPIQLAPYASVQRQGLPQLTPINIIHEGGVAALGPDKPTLRLQAFKDWKKKGDTQVSSVGGWTGVTDKYWLAAVAPDQKETVNGGFRVSQANGVDVYEANYVGATRALAPGAAVSETTHLFAGAKKVSILADYEKALGIPHFDDAVDWGNLWFLTRPIFWLLELFHKLIGNFGVAILLLTVVVKLILFPLANKSFESMSKMKKLQPEIEKIKKAHPDDATKVQQETMELYKREKINPVAGCLPVVVQIPIWYALYKVLYVTLEMRHAPFFGWIHDLSAPDPTSFVNLFGLIPWNPGATPLIGGVLGGALAIGIWPVLYGLVQWLTTNMNPQQGIDPTQKLMFQLFPLVFTFMLAHSPAGILIYWTWSSSLTILQQYYIMHRYGADNPIDSFIAKLRGRGSNLPAQV